MSDKKEGHESHESHNEHGHGDTKCGKYCGLNLWSVVRILIAAGLIVGAYIWGVMAGMNAVDSRSGMRYGPSWNDDNHIGSPESRRNRGGDRPNMPMKNLDANTPMNMSMAAMGKMLEGKTGDDLDKAFLEMMIPHHQGAIDMAGYLTGAKHDELKKLGADIIGAQAKEIEQMQKWMTDWGYAATGSTELPMDHNMMNH